ncbi:MAG: hypothetical protein FJ194_09835 [Gammaproteobacteria bacterium]|nr:hypothetical protein [Gammaproteobacteria bacterium]
MSTLNHALLEQFRPVLEDITERSGLVEQFIDKDTYCILAGTVWANVVLDPGAAGVDEDDLPDLHDVLSHWSEPILGKEDGNVSGIFRFLNSKAGERAMQAAQITPNHRDLLLFFASMILDPEGHRRWTDAIRDRQAR